MTKIKIGGQKYDLDDLPESFRNRIKSQLDKEGIKYDKEDEEIEGDDDKKVDNKKSDIKLKIRTDRQEKKKEKNIEKKGNKQEKMSFFRKMFGYP